MDLIKSIKAGIATAMAKNEEWLALGFTLEYVSPAVQLERIELCEGCPKFLPDTRQCGICECQMDFKTKLSYDPFIGMIKLDGKVPILCADEDAPKWGFSPTVKTSKDLYNTK